MDGKDLGQEGQGAGEGGDSPLGDQAGKTAVVQPDHSEHRSSISQGQIL